VLVRLKNDLQGRFLSQGLKPSKKWTYYKSIRILKSVSFPDFRSTKKLINATLSFRSVGVSGDISKRVFVEAAPTEAKIRLLNKNIPGSFCVGSQTKMDPKNMR
jgi:hypothetical protein